MQEAVRAKIQYAFLKMPTSQQQGLIIPLLKSIAALQDTYKKQENIFEKSSKKFEKQSEVISQCEKNTAYQVIEKNIPMSYFSTQNLDQYAEYLKKSSANTSLPAECSDYLKDAAEYTTAMFNATTAYQKFFNNPSTTLLVKKFNDTIPQRTATKTVSPSRMR